MVYWWAQIGMIYTPKFLIIGDGFLGIPTNPTWQEQNKFDLARSEFHFWHPDTSPWYWGIGFHPISIYLYWLWYSFQFLFLEMSFHFTLFRNSSWNPTNLRRTRGLPRSQLTTAAPATKRCVVGSWPLWLEYRGDPFVPLWHNGGVWNCWKGVKRETTIQTQKYVGMRKLMKLDGLLIFVVFTFVFEWQTDIERGAGQKLETWKVPRTCELPNHWG